MMSLPQVMQRFKCSKEDAIVFLNAANEEELMHLEPKEAANRLLVIYKKKMKDRFKQELMQVFQEVAEEIIIEAHYDQSVPLKDLN